jgi:hypothetical protein
VNTVDEPSILLQVIQFWRNRDRMKYVRGMGVLNALEREE